MSGEDADRATLASILERNNQPELFSPGQLVERINQIDFASQAAKTMALLVVGEAIQLQGTRVQVDPEAARLVLSSHVTNEQSTAEESIPIGNETNEQVADLNTEELRHNFQSAVERMVEGGVLSADFAQRVERLLALEDIRQVDGKYARFVYEGSGFPQSDQKRGYIELGKQMVAIYSEKIKKIARQHGLSLTEQQCSAVASQVIFMHEYGHAALQTKKASELEKRNTTGEVIGFETVVEVDKQINRLVANQVASSSELRELFANEPTDELASVDERVASGFEIAALWNGLHTVGVDQDQVEMLVQAYVQERKNQLEEKKQIIMFAQSKGIELHQLDSAMQELFMTLRKTEPALAEKCRGGFGPQTLGYDFPLSPSELERLCKDEI